MYDSSLVLFSLSYYFQLLVGGNLLHRSFSVLTLVAVTASVIMITWNVIVYNIIKFPDLVMFLNLGLVCSNVTYNLGTSLFLFSTIRVNRETLH